MLILFDHGTPRGLARAFPDHAIITAQARGWDRLNNGDLLNAAEDALVDLLLTTDQRIRYQQNLKGRKIALVVWVRPSPENTAHAIGIVAPAEGGRTYRKLSQM